MIKSMTGYGASEETQGGWRCQVTVRSVNSKYLDMQLSLPKICESQEAALRQRIKGRISRGKVRVEVGFFLSERPLSNYQINREVVGAYLQEASSYFGIDTTALSLGEVTSLLNLPHALQKVDEAVPPEQAEALLIPALEKALLAHEDSVLAEGRWLGEDILRNLASMDTVLKEIKHHVPSLEDQYRERFLLRMERTLPEGQWDENRVLQEVAIFAEKTDISEECVRLESHIQALEGFIRSDETEGKGKKCDFYLQEMNREVNTIGSKIADITVTEGVIELKNRVEKMREQVQNIA